MNVYQENGYRDRADYLEHMAMDYGLDKGAVFAVAAVLGPSEDFDGLVVALQDEADRAELDREFRS